jgi:Phage capsid family
MSAILEKINEFGDAVVSMRKAHEERIAALQERIEELETKRDAPRRSADNTGGPAFTLIDKEGRRFPALTKSQSFYEYVRALPGATEEGDFSLGEYVRGAMLGERKVASGAALVPTRIGAQIIDDVRAQTSLIRAGAATIPIEAPTNFARITADATVYEHTEATADISEGSPTFAAVTANPKTLASLIPLSLEVVADSPNLDAALRTSISAAMALKLDQLGLAVILADATIPDSSVAHDPATFVGTLLAVGAAMTANQPVPDAAIVNSANFVARHSILESTAGGWLGKPPVLASMFEVPTTSMTVDISVLGGFQRGVAVAMRQDLTLEMVRFGKPTSGQHYLVAYMRAAAIVLQPKSLFIQKKVP